MPQVEMGAFLSIFYPELENIEQPRIQKHTFCVNLLIIFSLQDGILFFSKVWSRWWVQIPVNNLK